MFSLPFITVVNHLLAQADWARAALAEHAGKSAQIEIFPTRVAFSVEAGGTLRAAADSTTPDVTIRLTPASALQILAQGEKAWNQADVQGDSGFASAISRIAANLRWDAEEDLSRVFGDVAAHRMARGGRAAAAWPKQAAQSLAAAIGEYLTEEKHLLVTPLRAAEFAREVDELRDAVERLDKRLERLQQQIDGG